MESFTEYKIKITNNKDAILTARLFGHNMFWADLNYGSDAGIDIEVTKDGEPTSYISLLHESATTPINVARTTIVSPTKNIQKLFHYEKPLTSHDLIKTGINGYESPDYELSINVIHYEINADVYLETPVLNNSVYEITLQAEKQKTRLNINKS